MRRPVVSVGTVKHEPFAVSTRPHTGHPPSVCSSAASFALTTTTTPECDIAASLSAPPSTWTARCRAFRQRLNRFCCVPTASSSSLVSLPRTPTKHSRSSCVHRARLRYTRTGGLRTSSRNANMQSTCTSSLRMLGPDMASLGKVLSGLTQNDALHTCGALPEHGIVEMSLSSPWSCPTSKGSVQRLLLQCMLWHANTRFRNVGCRSKSQSKTHQGTSFSYLWRIELKHIQIANTRRIVFYKTSLFLVALAVHRRIYPREAVILLAEVNHCTRGADAPPTSSSCI